jgi:hypothetical protein
MGGMGGMGGMGVSQSAADLLSAAVQDHVLELMYRAKKINKHRTNPPDSKMCRKVWGEDVEG